MVDTAYPYDDDDEEELRENRRLRDRLERVLPAVLKKTVSTGRGAANFTEDVIRGAIGEMKLPREAVLYLVELADNTKKEVVRVAAREFREFLESANLTEEVAKLLTTLSFEVRTEIRFIPNDQRLKPNVRSSVKLKNNGKGEPGEAEPDERSVLAEGLDELIRAGASELAEFLRVNRTDKSQSEASPSSSEDSEETSSSAGAKSKTRSRRSASNNKKSSSARSSRSKRTSNSDDDS